MKRIICIIPFFIMLTSCFEILEQFDFNDDGSGSFKVIANLSQSKTKLKTIMLKDEVNGHKIPSKNDIVNKLNEIEKLAKATKGISNVNHKTDFTNFIFTFSCDFNSASSLNKMVQNIRVGTENKSVPYEKYISVNKDDKFIKRNFTFAWSNQFLKLSKEDKEVFKDATFTGVYKLKNEVLSNSNKEAKVSANKKAVMLKMGLMDIINKTKTIQNKIQYK